MKQDISALMDGELFDDEAETLLGRLKRNPTSQAEWHTYHLIGDALRQPGHLHVNIAGVLKGRIEAEPTVLAPVRRAKQNARWFALSAAASVLALTVITWNSVHVGGSPVAPPLAVQPPADGAVRPASAVFNRNMNDYLLAHQEFSPSNDVQGSASYIRAVAGQ